ncbi:hypothetical protein Tco_0334216, partial [Tanacetum coccineum]
DEDAMDKEVADQVKDHKRKHDSDDDEGPSAGSNQGRSTKKRRSDSAASGSANPPPKDSEWLGRVVHCITGSMMTIFNVSNHLAARITKMIA